MQQADMYPPLGPEYDDDPTNRPSRGTVFAIIGILLVFAFLFSAAVYEVASPLISSYL